MEGRKAIAKSLLLSQFTYLSTVMSITNDQISQAQTCINQFILGNSNGGRAWISEDRMYLPTSQGGLDLIELGSFFKGMTLSWVKRYVVKKRLLGVYP